MRQMNEVNGTSHELWVSDFIPSPMYFHLISKCLFNIPVNDISGESAATVSTAGVHSVQCCRYKSS